MDDTLALVYMYIGETETEETIKKSRFIGRCGPAATFEEGKALLGRSVVYDRTSSEKANNVKRRII